MAHILLIEACAWSVLLMDTDNVGSDTIASFSYGCLRATQGLTAKKEKLVVVLPWVPLHVCVDVLSLLIILVRF